MEPTNEKQKWLDLLYDLKPPEIDKSPVVSSANLNWPTPLELALLEDD